MSHLPVQSDLGPEFRFTSLLSGDRLNLVDLAGNFNIIGAHYIPARTFALSALGADVDLDGTWNAPGYSFAGWKHIASQGRDHYVKITYAGYMFPFGHKAVQITIVERVQYDDPANPNGWSDAVLRVQEFIKIIQPVKTYPAFGQPFAGHSWPFAQVEMKTLITPPLLSPPPPLGGLPSAVQLLDGSSNPVLWSMVATDEAGTAVHLHMPQIFVYGLDSRNGYPDPHDVAAMQAVAAAYNALDPSVRSAPTAGEHLRLAPEAGNPAGSTSHPLLAVTLEAATTALDPTAPGTVPPGQPTLGELTAVDQPAFFPVLGEARIRLQAAEGLSGSSFNDAQGAGIGVEYYPAFVVGGLPDAGNPGTVYAALTESTGATPNPPLLTFPTNNVGGISAPNIALTGLSGAAGIVAGPLDTYAQLGRQVPHDYFNPKTGEGGTSFPNLFGGLQLFNILGAFENQYNMPTIVNHLDTTTGTRTLHYAMEATLVPWGPAGEGNVFNPTAGGSMTLDALVTIAPNQPPTYKVKGSIDPFSIDIIGTAGDLNFLIIPFTGVTFSSASGAKSKVDVTVGSVAFQGPLTFMNALEQFMGAFGQGFATTVTPTVVKSGFSFTLPTISIGIVDVSNFGLSTSLEIPFLNSPALASFSFASKEHQFLVSVSMFGGGGYVTLVLGLTSVQTVSVQVQFCGNFSIDLVVVSGGLTVAAGISYLYQNGVGVTLVGFVHITGDVEVLGIISVSAELDMSLTFFSGPTSSYVQGAASLSLSVHIIFFTVSVGFTITKTFAGSDNNAAAAAPLAHAAGRRALGPDRAGAGVGDPVTPPSFAQVIPDPGTWSTYCSSFAA